VFIDGKKAVTLRGPNIQTEFRALVETYVEKRFGMSAKGADATVDAAE